MTARGENPKRGQPARKDPAGLLQLVAGASLIALGSLMHVAFFLTAGPLFRDDAHEVHFASGASFRELVDNLWLDSSPLVYKFFLRAWSSLGDSDLHFRAGALLIACAFITAAAVLFTKSGERRLPLLTLALPVLSPYAVQQFDALRPYGLGILGMTLFMAAYLRYFRQPGRRAYAATALLAVLAANTTYHACFFILATCLGGAFAAALVLKKGRHAVQLLLLGTWPLLAVLPYTPIVRRASYWVVTQQLPFPVSLSFHTLIESAGTVTLVAMGTILVTTLIWLFREAFGWRPDVKPTDSLRAAGPRTRLGTAVTVLALVTLTTFGALTLASFQSSAIMPTPLRFIPLLVMTALCLDVMLAEQPRTWHAVVGAGILLASALSASPMLEEVTKRQTNLDLVAHAIEESATSEDLILLRSWSSAITFLRYYRGPTPLVTVPNLADHGTHRYDLLRHSFETPAPHADVFEAVERTLKGGGRMFLVGHFRNVPMTGTIKALTPAPHPQYGYYKVPYLHNGEDRVFQFIIQHVRHVKLATPEFESAFREELPLMVVTGWHEEE